MMTKRRSVAVAGDPKSRVERKQRQKQNASQTTEVTTQRDTSEALQAKQSRRQQRAEQKKEKRKQRKPRRRIFPIWLRIIVVTILCAAGLVLGAMVGYGVIGDGDPKDVLQKETWLHIYDIVFKQE